MGDEEKLAEIFSTALGKAVPEERERYLSEACGDDVELRQQLDSLLQAQEEAGNFLGQPVVSSPASVVGEGPGSMIGRYKLLQEIGEGGFGIVFMAEQQEPVRRMVALKVLKPGMDTREIIARFEAERQALALMDHPNIARVLDGGTTASGRPYFVMDLVKGIPITHFCDQNQLSTEARLQLFLQVCGGVEHAHQKGIIHRDIKPTNVLVMVQGGKTVPKVIDFGIAKALGQKLTERTLFTRFEQLLGTPAYMSPEQAEWGGIDIDTRSDIYSLGALLYELLTGTTPFEKETLAKAALVEVRRIIRETDPPTPSVRLQGLGQRLEEISRQRQVPAFLLPRKLRGELDWIVMKALEKDRARRYETVNALAHDLDQHLNGEPVAACPPSNWYRLKKLIIKNKTAFAGSAFVAVSLTAGLAVSIWMFLAERQAKREQAHLRELADSREQRAQAEANKKQEVASILKNMLRGASPEVAKGRDITVLREVLDRTAVEVRTQLTNQPEVQVEALATLGDVYEDLQLFPQMEGVARESVVIAKARLGETNALFADAIGAVGRAWLGTGQLEQSEAYLRKAVALKARLSGGHGPETANLLDGLGRVLIARGKWQEAESLYRELLATQPQSVASRAESLNNLALVLKNQGRSAEAETLQRESVALSQQTGKESLDMLSELQNLGSQMSQSQRLSEAETLYREALELSRKLWGKDNSKHLGTVLSLVDCLASEKKYDEADKVFSELLDSEGAWRPEDASLLAGRADYLAHRGLWKEAATNLCEAIRLQPTNSSRYATLAYVLAGAGESSAYTLLNPQITGSAPAGAFDLLVQGPGAKAWQTFEGAPAGSGLNTRATAIGTDPTGRVLYSAGWRAAAPSGQSRAVIQASHDSGQTWATLDAWLPDVWPYAEYMGFCCAPNGYLFGGGDTSDKDSSTATIDWFLRRSTDGGVTWTLQDRVDSGVGGKAHCRAVLAAPSGEIYAAGVTATNQGAGGWVWLVRKSSDDGATWTTVDSVWDYSAKEARATGRSAKGSVFVAGLLNASFGAEGGGVWAVRRSTDNGVTWATVDSYQTAPGLAAEAWGIAADKTGAIYVAGMAKGRADGGNKLVNQWVVRRSFDDGNTWSVVDNLTLGPGAVNSYSTLSGPTAITVDASGGIFVCGYMTALDHSQHWLVRKGVASSDGGIDWSTIDNYQMTLGRSARANGVVSDGQGDIYVAGRAADTAGREHWIIRRLPQ